MVNNICLGKDEKMDWPSRNRLHESTKKYIVYCNRAAFCAQLTLPISADIESIPGRSRDSQSWQSQSRLLAWLNLHRSLIYTLTVSASRHGIRLSKHWTMLQRSFRNTCYLTIYVFCLTTKLDWPSYIDRQTTPMTAIQDQMTCQQRRVIVDCKAHKLTIQTCTKSYRSSISKAHSKRWVCFPNKLRCIF
jgi:hypothetical protein